MRGFVSIICVLILLTCGNAIGQIISAETIAQSIQDDSGLPKENYEDYSQRLVLTLGQLTTAQLSRVMDGTLVVGSTGTSTGATGGSTGSSGSTTGGTTGGTGSSGTTATNNTTPVSLNDQLALDNIEFSLGSSKLKASAFEQLDKVAEFLITNPDATIEIEGHVSIDYSEAQALSEDRADAAKQYLIDLGMDPDRIITVGKGFSEPSGSESNSRFGATADRRIEFTLLPTSA